MNLHEFQAKALFRDAGLPVANGKVVTDSSTVDAVLSEIGGTRWVVKAQVHAGGRGKAGGVQLVNDGNAARAFVDRFIGTRLVTYQTDEHGSPVNHILIEPCTDIARELYLGVVIDRASRRIAVMASQEGGVEIEKVAHETPEAIHTVFIDPMVGPQPYQGRALAYALGLTAEQMREFVRLFLTTVDLFVAKDLSLVEINPLVVTEDGALLCLDAKVNVDDNALYRQKDIAALHDPAQEDAREAEANKHDLNYVALDGTIGCMVNGAGLAMGTMDLVKLHGGSPANFLDVGGTATKERVAEAFKIIVADSNVRAILVNIFGGIVRCDLIAEGIIAAVREVGVHVPVIVRLEGNNADTARTLLADSGLNIMSATSLNDAAEHAAQSARTA